MTRKKFPLAAAVLSCLTLAAPASADWNTVGRNSELAPVECTYRLLAQNRFAGGNVVTPLVNTDFILFDGNFRNKKTTVRFAANDSGAHQFKSFVIASQQADFENLFAEGLKTGCSLELTSEREMLPGRRGTANVWKYELTCSFANGEAHGQAAFEVDGAKVVVQSSCRK